jgi:hypothetical protein
LGTFTELLDRLREFGFKIVKAKYDVVDENVAGFEVHVLYSDGSATWFFAFTCSSDAPRFPTFGFGGTPHYSAPYASGLRPHVRGRHSSVPTGLGLRPQPSQHSAQARGQSIN